MSVGVVADYFTVGDVNWTGLMADLQVPVGMPLRVRVPLAVTGTEPLFDKAGLGNVSVGVAKGLELGLGAEMALVVGVDVGLPTNRGEDGVFTLYPMRGADYAPNVTTVTPHASFGFDTPVFDVKAYADASWAAYREGIGDADAEVGSADDTLVRVGAVAAFSVMPLVGVALAADILKDLGGDADALVYAAPGVRLSLPPLIDIGIHVPIGISGHGEGDTPYGVTLDVSAGL